MTTTTTRGDDDGGTPTTREMRGNRLNPTGATSIPASDASTGGQRRHHHDLNTPASTEDEDDFVVERLEAKLATLRRNHPAEVVEDAHTDKETGRRLTVGELASKRERLEKVLKDLSEGGGGGATRVKDKLRSSVEYLRGAVEIEKALKRHKEKEVEVEVRRNSMEFVTVAQMAEGRSPGEGAKKKKSQRGGGAAFEEFRCQGDARTTAVKKKKQRTPRDALEDLEKALDGIEKDDIGGEISPEQFYGRRASQATMWDLARRPTRGSRMVDAALGRPSTTKTTETTMKTYHKRSAPPAPVVTGGKTTTTKDDADENENEDGNDKKKQKKIDDDAEEQESPRGATQTTTKTQRKKKKKKDETDDGPIMVDLLDDEERNADDADDDDDSKKSLQKLEPVNLLSMADDGLRRSTRSSRYRSLQTEVGNLVTTYPAGVKGAVQITLGDLEYLRDGEMLNDQCVDFFMKYLQCNLMDKEIPELSKRVHIFNSFFYQKLTQKQSKENAGESVDAVTAAHRHVKGWTKGVDIFSKDFLLIPIHNALHWSLVIVCYPGGDVGGERQPMILHLDSMTQSGGHPSDPLSRNIKKYLDKEWTAQRGEECSKFTSRNFMPTYRMNTPRQQNGCDCGVFILAFVEKFLIDLPDVLKKSYVQESIQKKASYGAVAGADQFLRKNWFPNEVIDELRMKLSCLVIDTIKTSIPEDDLSKSILQAAYDAHLRQLDERQSLTRKAEAKRERNAASREQGATGASKGDGKESEEEEAEEVNVTVEVKAKPKLTQTKFAGSNWTQASKKEPSRDTVETKTFAPFTGAARRLGRSEEAPKAPPREESGAWTAGNGNKALMQRYERRKVREERGEAVKKDSNKDSFFRNKLNNILGWHDEKKNDDDNKEKE